MTASLTPQATSSRCAPSLFKIARQALYGRVGAWVCACCGLLLMTLCSCHSNARQGSASSDHLVGEPPAPTNGGHTPFGTRQPARAPTREGVLWYRITHQDDALQVSLRLLDPPDTFSLFLPGRWAGQDDWDQYIHIKEARTPAGPSAFTLQRHIGRLDLAMRGEKPGWVELHYEVKLAARTGVEDRFSPQRLTRNEGFFVYAPTIFILPSEKIASSMRQIPVELHVQRGHTPVTTWVSSHNAPSSQNPSHQVHGFVLEDVAALRDAFLLVARDVQREERSTSLEIAYDSQFQGETEAISSFIDATLQHYGEALGMASAHTTALIRTPGARFTRSQRWGTGRRGGFVLELEQEASLDQSARLLIAHEAFHLWNGHALVPDTESELETRWFKEGLTHYIALKTLFEQGHLDERDFLDEIAQSASRYQAAHRQHPGSRDARQNLPLYPYDKGVLLALYLDALLHAATLPPRGERASGARASLMAWLLTLLDYSRTYPQWRYTQEDLFLSLEPFISPDTDDFQAWRRYGEERDRLDLDTFFSALGLHWLDAEPGRQAKLIPLQRKEPSWKDMMTTRQDQ